MNGFLFDDLCGGAAARFAGGYDEILRTQVRRGHNSPGAGNRLSDCLCLPAPVEDDEASGKSVSGCFVFEPDGTSEHIHITAQRRAIFSVSRSKIADDCLRNEKSFTSNKIPSAKLRGFCSTGHFLKEGQLRTVLRFAEGEPRKPLR